MNKIIQITLVGRANEDGLAKFLLAGDLNCQNGRVLLEVFIIAELKMGGGLFKLGRSSICGEG